MRKSYFFLIILLSFAKLTNAQYQIKIKAVNTLIQLSILEELY
jgi:hypothetical protein